MQTNCEGLRTEDTGTNAEQPLRRPETGRGHGAPLRGVDDWLTSEDRRQWIRGEEPEPSLLDIITGVAVLIGLSWGVVWMGIWGLMRLFG